MRFSPFSVASLLLLSLSPLSCALVGGYDFDHLEEGNNPATAAGSGGQENPGGHGGSPLAGGAAGISGAGGLAAAGNPPAGGAGGLAGDGAAAGQAGAAASGQGGTTGAAGTGGDAGQGGSGEAGQGGSGGAGQGGSGDAGAAGSGGAGMSGSSGQGAAGQGSAGAGHAGSTQGLGGMGGQAGTGGAGSEAGTGGQGGAGGPSCTTASFNLAGNSGEGVTMCGPGAGKALSSGRARVGSVAVDDTHVYFAERSPDGLSGFIGRVRKNGEGGTEIITDLVMGEQLSPRELRIDPATSIVYWLSDSNATGMLTSKVWQFNPCSNHLSPVATNAPGVISDGLTLDDKNLYWTLNCGETCAGGVATAPKNGSGLPTSTSGLLNPRALVAEGGFLYVSSDEQDPISSTIQQGQVMRIDLAKNTAVRVVNSGLDGPVTALITTPDRIVAVYGTHLSAVDKSTLQESLLSTGSERAAGIFFDGAHLLFTVGGAVQSVPSSFGSGGAAQTIGCGSSLQGLVADGSALYWADQRLGNQKGLITSLPRP